MTKKKKSILRYFTPVVGGIYLLKDVADAKNKTTPMRRCFGCGKLIPSDYNWCPHCGKKVKRR